jgi:hypothetical protein
MPEFRFAHSSVHPSGHLAERLNPRHFKTEELRFRRVSPQAAKAAPLARQEDLSYATRMTSIAFSPLGPC